jgi:hypothetical protein
MKLLVILLLVCYQARAEWVTYAQAPKITYEYQTERMTTHNNNGRVIVVWAKTTTPKSTMTNHYEVHCPTHMTRAFTQLTVDNTGNNSIYYEDYNVHWHFAVPDSPEWVLADTVCN